MIDDKFQILNTLKDSIAILNRSGEIIFTNAAWNNYGKENMADPSCIGPNNNYLTVCNTSTAEDSNYAEKAESGIRKVIERKQKYFELEYPCHSPNEKRWFILRASAVITDPDLTLVAHCDITGRKVAELAIERNYNKTVFLNESLENTLYKVVHDIQNPLASIMGLTQLSKSESDINTIKSYLNYIQEGSTELRAFIQTTLKHLSDSGKVEVIDIKKLINEYIRSVEHLLKSNSIEVRQHFHQKTDFLSNVIELRSIISNLIDNAIKFIEKDETKKLIEVEFTSDISSATLKVKDNGIGIKKEYLPKLLEFNYQVNENTNDGKGLGLYMVKRSVMLLGGTINVNSEFGTGSEFIIQLPNNT